MSEAGLAAKFNSLLAALPGGRVPSPAPKKVEAEEGDCGKRDDAAHDAADHGTDARGPAAAAGGGQAVKDAVGLGRGGHQGFLARQRRRQGAQVEPAAGRGRVDQVDVLQEAAAEELADGGAIGRGRQPQVGLARLVARGDGVIDGRVGG